MRHLRTLIALSLAACAGPGSGDSVPDAEEPADFGIDAPQWGMHPAGEPSKEDAVNDARAVSSTADTHATRVWSVTNAWEDTATTAAKKAGMAWAANSGLDWNQKYAAWVASMPATTGVQGYRTFMVTTPYGKSVPAP